MGIRQGSESEECEEGRGRETRTSFGTHACMSPTKKKEEEEEEIKAGGFLQVYMQEAARSESSGCERRAKVEKSSEEDSPGLSGAIQWGPPCLWPQSIVWVFSREGEKEQLQATRTRQGRERSARKPPLQMGGEGGR